ncbi:hypothetical protein HBI56_182620 [Parastagonospora nodorum]|uniref:Uncharacterized protein n=1 Tax=Phaeosphaeria nodorum (strain SN15 / ATCC MYA-4574 / FGSC 10173) TaxID=321614 RepID=A0A7U2FD74_PHANO|nr:hypothetical protein HBH56_191100 [Parastagonospora nodorum]QRD03137.1 hypothetical protein JI435_140960 [Parastagonospora nodorum SN15]KAH3938179.1 hypothetical protein HBH54_010900 [Parastagonospora nodorum]KAH3940816.1 hypothetical protein HBH53_211440 [Parastagonospora nodorum]KAH3966503.1 hypothetical protein HBH52_199920 [Parastagonospora nodorum]
MSSQGGKTSKRQQQKEERRQYHQRGRAEKKSAQDGIKDNLPFDLPNQPRVHLLKSLYLYGPKSDRFVKEGERLLITVMKRMLIFSSLYCHQAQHHYE